MFSWNIAAATDEYKEAISATASLAKDTRGVGFIAPHEYPTNLADTHIQQQNNTIIHLLVQALEEVKTLKEKVQVLTDKVTSLEQDKGKAKVDLSEEVVEQITKQLGELKGPGKTGAVKGQGSGSFRVWK